jgi:hypothetical protein
MSTKMKLQKSSHFKPNCPIERLTFIWCYNTSPQLSRIPSYEKSKGKAVPALI